VNLEARSVAMSSGRAAMSAQSLKFGQQHAAFPLPEGEVSLSFPAELSVGSAQTMAAFVNLLLKQAEQQAKSRADLRNDIGAAIDSQSGNSPSDK
jgi:hypothetical protein